MSEKFWQSSVIASRYENRGELGRGGIGTVYLAHDRTLDKLVAIKVLNSNLSPDQTVRFQQEGKIAARLAHRNIVSVMDFGVTDNGQPYLIMEYLRGKSLRSLIEEDSIDVRQAVSVFIDTCAALAHSHKNNVLHRDLKPENVILSQSDSGNTCVKVVDFGLARVVDNDARITQTGSMLGSPLYMSPEQCDGKNVDKRSDIYSMGCLMFHALSGQPPFHGETAMETVLLHRNETAPALSDVSDRRFPSELEHIVGKCLKKKGGERFQSFDDLKEALARVEAVASAPPPLIQLPEPKRRERAEFLPPGFIKLFVLLLIPGVVAVYFLAFRPVQEAPKVMPIVPPRKERKRDMLEKVRDLHDDTFHIRNEAGINGVTVDKGTKPVGDDTLSQLRPISLISSLNLGNSNVQGVGFSKLPSTTIRRLILEGSPVTNAGLKQIAKIPGLTELFIRKTTLVTTDGLANLTACPELRSLAYGGLGLDESSLKVFKSGPKFLEKIHLRDMKVTDAGIGTIEEIKPLRSLQLSRCDVTPAAWSRLSRMKRLSYLCVSSATLSHDQLKCIVDSSIPQLGLLEVKIGPDDLPLLEKAASRLTTADVISPNSTEEQREAVLSKLPTRQKKIVEHLELEFSLGEEARF